MHELPPQAGEEAAAANGARRDRDPLSSWHRDGHVLQVSQMGGQEAKGAMQSLTLRHPCRAGSCLSKGMKLGCAFAKSRSFTLWLCPPGSLPRFYTTQHKTWVLQGQLQRAPVEET